MKLSAPLLVSLAAFSQAVTALVAFPGAEGFCSYTEVANTKGIMIAAEIPPCQGNTINLGNLQGLLLFPSLATPYRQYEAICTSSRQSSCFLSSSHGAGRSVAETASRSEPVPESFKLVTT
jgi:hypothetical protein